MTRHTTHPTQEAPMSESDEPKAYVWAWRYGSLGVEEFESLSAAVAVSHEASDRGEEYVHCIEVPAKGRVYDKEEVYDLWRPIEDAEDARFQSAPRNVAAVMVTSPDGKERANYEGYSTRAKADEVASELRKVFGDRVTVRDIP
jgi:hypothetical protein